MRKGNERLNWLIGCIGEQTSKSKVLPMGFTADGYSFPDGRSGGDIRDTSFPLERVRSYERQSPCKLVLLRDSVPFGPKLSLTRFADFGFLLSFMND